MDFEGYPKGVKIMPEIWAGQLGELRIASDSKGTALSTTAAFIQLPPKTDHVFITPRNFSTAVVARFLFNPWLCILHTDDSMKTEPTDYSLRMQDPADTSTLDLSSMATGTEFILMGSTLPYRGVYVDVTGTNAAGTATMGVSYSNAAKDFTAYSVTDGTNSTMTLAQDGLVYWTVADAWTPIKFNELYPALNLDRYYSKIPLYWTKWTPSVALTDTSITVVNLSAANRSTSYAELIEGQPLEERVDCGKLGGFSCLEALTDDGTANLIVNVACRQEGVLS
jgi:hypothetical protein